MSEYTQLQGCVSLFLLPGHEREDLQHGDEREGLLPGHERGDSGSPLVASHVAVDSLMGSDGRMTMTINLVRFQMDLEGIQKELKKVASDLEDEDQAEGPVATDSDGTDPGHESVTNSGGRSGWYKTKMSDSGVREWKALAEKKVSELYKTKDPGDSTRGGPWGWTVFAGADECLTWFTLLSQPRAVTKAMVYCLQSPEPKLPGHLQCSLSATEIVQPDLLPRDPSPSDASA